MGTNIYARVNPPKAEREKFVLKVKEIVDSDDLFALSKLEDLLQQLRKWKYSASWQGKPKVAKQNLMH